MAVELSSGFFIRVKTIKEIVIGTVIDFSKLNQYADADIQFAGFIFFVSGSANITGAALQFGTQFFLRESILFT